MRQKIEQLSPSSEWEPELEMPYLQLRLLADGLCDEGLGLRGLPGGKAQAGWSPTEQPMQ